MRKLLVFWKHTNLQWELGGNLLPEYRPKHVIKKGVFFGTIFPAIFVGPDSESYYRTGCECDSCILGNVYH